VGARDGEREGEGERLEAAVRKDGEVRVERLEPGWGEGRRGVMYWEADGERREELWWGRDGRGAEGEARGLVTGIGTLWCLLVRFGNEKERENDVLPEVERATG
jgi:hypothetical protein